MSKVKTPAEEFEAFCKAHPDNLISVDLPDDGSFDEKTGIITASTPHLDPTVIQSADGSKGVKVIVVGAGDVRRDIRDLDYLTLSNNMDDKAFKVTSILSQLGVTKAANYKLDDILSQPLPEGKIPFSIAVPPVTTTADPMAEWFSKANQKAIGRAKWKVARRLCEQKSHKTKIRVKRVCFSNAPFDKILEIMKGKDD
jgi:hypothetical protein